MRIHLKKQTLDHETRFKIQHSKKHVIDLESSEEEPVEDNKMEQKLTDDSIHVEDL